MPHRCKKHTASFARSTGKFPSMIKQYQTPSDIIHIRTIHNISDAITSILGNLYWFLLAKLKAMQ